MTYKILTLNESKEWLEALHNLPQNQQDVYYTPNYYSLYEAYGDGVASCFVYEKDGELAIYPFLKSSINSIGYKLNDEYFDCQGAYGYNGIVSSSTEKSFITNFHDCFKEYCIKNNIVADFTRFHPLLKNENLASKQTKVVFDRKTVYIDLSNEIDEIISNIQHGTLRQIKRAKNRYNIITKIYTNPVEQLDVVFDIYTQTMKKVKASSYLFFNKEYFSNLLSMHNSVLFVAYFENNPIAFISSFYSKEYFHGHLSSSVAMHLHKSPNSFLYYEMICYAKEIGCKYLHFGGGDSTQPDNALLKFKTNFSKELSDFYFGKTIFNQTIYNEIVEQWKTKYPQSFEKNHMKVLGYRDI